MYYSGYDSDALAVLAARVAASSPARGDACVIFDNTAHGHATPNALEFQGLLPG